MLLKKFISPDGSEIIIRKADLKDAEAIIAFSTLTLKTFTDVVLTTPEEFHPTIEQQREWINSFNNCDTGFLAIAESKLKMVGIIHFEVMKKKKVSHSGEFALAIHPDFHKQKIGSELLQQLVLWAKQNPKIEKVILNVAEHNQKAIDLYKKFGFVTEGVNIKAVKQPDGQYTNNVQMALFV